MGEDVEGRTKLRRGCQGRLLMAGWEEEEEERVSRQAGGGEVVVVVGK